MPRHILKALVAGLCGLGWRSGPSEDESAQTAAPTPQETRDTFVYDLPEKG